MQIRERIAGERAWEANTSITREFIHKMIARERGVTLPVFDSPGFNPPYVPETNPAPAAP
jgi:hypothetical protein